MSEAHRVQDDAKECLSEMTVRRNMNTCKLKSLWKFNYTHQRKSSGKNRNMKKRRSVSFVDEVMVYLFDQESPTLELHCEPCTSLSSSSPGSLPDVTLEDSGLEWDDDFSALERSSHFHCATHSVSQHYNLSMPTQSRTILSKPEHVFLPQTCLFLIHVTESDLEL